MSDRDTLKYCKKCEQDRPVTPDFWYFRGVAPVHPCKSCSSAIAKQVRAADSERLSAVRRERYAEKQEQHRARAAEFASENREMLRDRQREFRKRNKDRVNAELRAKRASKREELAEKGREWRRANPEKSREHTKTRRSKPGYVLHENIGRAMREMLRGIGAPKSKRKQDLLGWGAEDLLRHLETLFEDGMSFDNYGEWEVDHIVAKSLIPVVDENDVMFKLVWSLENLAPLWAVDNREKNNRIDWVLPATYRNPKLRARYANPLPELQQAIIGQ